MRPNLGEINFAAAIPVIDRIMGLFGLLEGVSLDYVALTRLQTLSQQIDDVINNLKQIEAFTLTVDNPRNQRDSIINNLNQHYNNWFENVFTIIAFSVRSKTDFAALERDLRQKIAQAEVISKELLEQQQAAAAQAQETLVAIQKAAAEAGVSQEAIYFSEEAKEHKASATKWAIGTGCMAAATIIWGFVALFLLTFDRDATTAQIVQHALGKIIILSGLYYGLVWTARNYAAARHNYVVNKHRQNSLSTFETFVKAAGADDDTKNAVLLQATTSIFTSQPSGYSTKEPEPDQPNKIIEILRSAGSAAKAAPG